MTRKVTPIGRVWKEGVRRAAQPPAQARLSWTRWVRSVDPLGTELTMGPVTGEPWRHIHFADVPAERRFIAAIDGKRTLTEAALAADLSLEAASSLVAELYAQAVLSMDGEVGIEGPLFCQHAASLCRDLILAHGNSPVLKPMWDGTASARLVRGYLLDVYHFALAAPSHIASAVASAPCDRLKLMYSEFLAEEYWHFAWLKQGLIAGGLSEAELARSEPTPGTMGKINYLRWLASSDPLAYASCLAMGEGAPERLPAREEFWQQFAAHGIVAEEVYRPFREHELLDYRESHERFGLEPFLEVGPREASERQRILRRVLYYGRLIPVTDRLIAAQYAEPEGECYFDPVSA